MFRFTLEQLKQVLSYDPDTGIFTWLVDRNNKVKSGSEAGYLNSNGYVYIQLFGQLCKRSRLAWFYYYGIQPDNQIDHINRVRNDDRIINLRDVTHNENSSNRSNNTSGQVGVNWDPDRNKWRSRIYIKGKTVSLGYFESKELAIQARKDAESKYNFYPDPV